MVKEVVWDWRTVQVDKAGTDLAGETVTVLPSESEFIDAEGFRTATVMVQVPVISQKLTLVFETAKSLEGPAPWVPFQTVTWDDCPAASTEYAVIAYMSSSVEANLRFLRYIRWRVEATGVSAGEVYDRHVCFRVVAVFND